jgi:D-sedoheptulose 7-phosphate isomerase
LKNPVTDALNESADVKRRTAQTIGDEIARAGELLLNAYRSGAKSLIFGNGGSAADAQHYAAELVGRFGSERRALPALALNVNASTITSVGNDYGYDYVFVREVEAFGAPGDVAIAISTSGNSPNVLAAIERARQLGLTVIGLTGKGGGKMKELCDLCVVVPSDSTPRIQETHITIIHIWCNMIDDWFHQSK